MDNLTREQALTEARKAAVEAKLLAGHAGTAAHGGEQGKAQGLAAAGALWADLARSFATIAAVTPELPTTDTES